MEYMTGYYRQTEDSTSLLLQQYVCCGVPVCLGCICGGESLEAGIAGGHFTGRLLEEFRRISLLKAVEKPLKYLGKMKKQIDKCTESCEFPMDFWMAGILCIGEHFLLISRGEVKIALCNTGFGRPVLQEIKGKESGERQRLQLQWGIMETGIGILLASKSFYGYIPEKDIQNCLEVRNINDSSQTRKRVQELGRVAERRGGRGIAALLLEVRQEKRMPGVLS